MEYLVTQAEMRQYDKNTIERLRMPALVLMERAALAAVEQIRREMGSAPYRVLVVAGGGNNGGDGLAIGRLLLLQGCRVDFVLFSSRGKCSKETARQLEILAQYGHEPYDRIPADEYDIVIDALFGVGLSREIEGIYREAVHAVNAKNSYVCAVDIPSGVHADSGQILGCAVKADLTVTFGFYKPGLFLYPGAGCCGKIVCGQIGIDEHSFYGKRPRFYTYMGPEDASLPARRPDGNKGTFGKALVIAGSSTICGAAMLAGKSVFRMGAGMVRVVTAGQNREILQQAMPEAMFTIYDAALWPEKGADDAFEDAFRKALAWADCILIGPGIGTDKAARWLLECCLRESGLPMVIDADGLNLLAEADALQDMEEIGPVPGRKLILTPHLGEFSRLFGCSIPEAAKNLISYPAELAGRLHCTVVCKDARTVVACPEREQIYLNTSGNAGMATAGSGDVLAGMITGLLAQGMEAEDAAVTGVYLHGLAGDMAALAYGGRSMTASDMIEQFPEVLRAVEGKSAGAGNEGVSESL
ncbi:MAG: NAD(P)H-hydrate dehydratase [Blautia sp.]|nr:NAD(P)H-hydrate dehydratase [Blautia sp.]MCM1200456.1 NAD(P)H-hydrate dehydratase [Bacteroides fragilis]